MVVGLDAQNVSVGSRMTKALRKAFAYRGMSGGDEANLSELRLALGCRSDAPACLAKGGEMLGARRLIYGSLSDGGKGSWELDLWIVQTEPAVVEEHQTFTLGNADLTPAQIDTTASRVVEQLLPSESAVADVDSDVAPLGSSEPLESEVESPPEELDGDKRLIWGPYRPRPGWKWAGFGVSTAVMAIGLGGYLGASIWLTADNIGFRRKLLEEAEASLADDKDINDVPPTLPEGVNLCDYARARPTDQDGTELGEPGQVRNARIVKVCDDGDYARRIGTGLLITGLVGTVSTAVFTTLLFVHRSPNAAQARRRREHQLRMGLGSVRGRGATFELSGRF